MGSDGIHFSPAAAERAVRFIECLTLTKSTLTGKPEPFKLLPHSRKIVQNVYGWRRADGRRLIEKVFASFGRKQAKTQTAAAIVALEFFLGSEAMQEIYFAASAADQAARCYEAVRDMITVDPELVSRCKITDSTRRIINTDNGNELKVISADGKKQHGLNPSMVVFDELHAWGPPEQELYDALTTGSMSRSNPLWVTITTAGSVKESICGREYDYAKRVLAGKLVDPSYLPIIYEVPETADWTDKSLWPLALPLLKTGHHDLAKYETEFLKAQVDASAQNKFRRLYLNQWTSTETQWINLHEWDASADPAFDESQLASIPCWGGLDLGSTLDLTAFSLCWPLVDGRVYVKTWGYLPEAKIEERERRDNQPYRRWAADGHLKLTPGNRTDWEVVRDHVLELRRKYRIQALAYDRWGARDTASYLMKKGVNVIDFGQGYSSMSPAVKRFEGLVRDSRIVHGGSPLMRWCIDCCRIKTDDAENKKLVKPPTEQHSKRIDAAVAAVMAIGVAMIADKQPTAGVRF